MIGSRKLSWHNLMPATTLLMAIFCFQQSLGQPQVIPVPASPQPARLVPAELVVPLSPGTNLTSPSPMPPPVVPVPEPAPPTPVPGVPAPQAAPVIATPASRPPPPPPACPGLDGYIRLHYPDFFMLTRLVNQYTHVNQPASAAGVPLNQTYLPLTVLAPSTSNTTDFLFNNNMPIQNLAENRRQVELLAPSLASHFVSGYFPAGNYPNQPVNTLCTDTCGPLSFVNKTSSEIVQLVQHPNVNVTITTPNVAVCPGKWVVHEVSSVLYYPNPNPANVTTPALNLAYALNGEWNTFPVTGATAGKR